MKLKDKVPFLGDEKGDKNGKQGRVRLLGKLDKVDNFSPDDFNRLLKRSVRGMENKVDNRAAVLDDKIEKDIAKEDLMDRHLTYQVKVGQNVNTDRDNEIIAEGTTLKVILRAQPSRAIEINGPHKVSAPYREAFKEAFREITGEKIKFQNLLSS